MNYFYDVIANFSNKYPLFFYEWDEKDKFIHIKKIPLFKVSSKTVEDFVLNNVIVTSNFLDLINNKTFIYKRDEVVTMPYVCIISDAKSALIVKFNKKGKVNGKSLLILEDDLNVIEMVNNFQSKKIDYFIKEKTSYSSLLKSENKVKNYLLSKIISLKSDNNQTELEYLYYELSGKRSGNLKVICKYLQDSLENLTDKHYEIYKIYNLICKNKV